RERPRWPLSRFRGKAEGGTLGLPPLCRRVWPFPGRVAIGTLHETGDAVMMLRQNGTGTLAKSADTLEKNSREDDVAALDAELAAYRQQANRLETNHLGKWVVFKDATLVAIHDSFDGAAKEATSRFGRGPYLIRQIGAAPILIPVSLAYRLN